jgi:hypothetical protein
MFERVARLHEALTGADKAEVGLLQNAYVEWTHSYTRDKTSANRKEWMSAKEALADAVERLWPQAFPAEAPRATDSGPVFKDKASAFAWYVENGGQRQKSSFYAVVPADGKKVSRLAVSEMLRKERPAAAPVDLSGRKEEADTRKAEADADKAEMQAAEMRREQDAKWVLRERADEETCVWVSRLRDATAYHLGRSAVSIIHACGGNPARLAEVQAIIDESLASAANEIAGSDEVTVTFEDDD